MTELIQIDAPTVSAATPLDQKKPMADDWTKQRQFGMTFEEQQEVLYNTLLSFHESD